MKLAIYAITANGGKQAKRLQRGLPFADIFVAAAGQAHCTDAKPLPLPLSRFVADKFNDYDGHIFICASGIVTRMISPLIKDKREDPAVVCLDEQATFAISLLSGHRGGGNELTERVAHIVKATPVITTASDVSEQIAVDMLGARFGWYLDPTCESAVTTVSAAVVNEQAVIIAQECGDKAWWRFDKPMPSNIICHHSLQDIDSEAYCGAVLISDKKYPQIQGWENKLVLWCPKSLVLGVGCDRNTPLSVLTAGLQTFSEQFNLSLDAVLGMASIDLKANEVGLLQLSKQKQWPYSTYAAEQLDGITGIENPSEYVKKVTGSNSVAEAAALKLSAMNTLIVAKWKFKQAGFNMTIACCRKNFSESLLQQKRKNWFGEKKQGSKASQGEKTLPIIEVNSDTKSNAALDAHLSNAKHVDLDRPMRNYRHHILLCEGKRCAKAGSKNLPHHLRTMLKKMGLNEGKNRIKISRTMCAGACRNRATLVIYERNQSGPVTINNGQWLRNIEQLSEQQWQTLFTTLAENNPITQVLDKKYFASVEAPIEENNCG